MRQPIASATGVFVAALALAFLLAGPSLAQDQLAPQPSPLRGLAYNEPFFPEAKHDPEVPDPDTLLGFPVGSRPATHGQIEAVFKALGAKSPRCKLIDTARHMKGARSTIWSSPP